MTSVKKDLISQKGSLVTLYVKPRKCAKKNIYVIGGKEKVNYGLDFNNLLQAPKENLAVPGLGVSALIKLWNVSIHSRMNGGEWPVWILEGNN